MAVDDATGVPAALLLAGCVLAPDPASGGASRPAPGPAPPNLLRIVAEDHGPHHGSYADPCAPTPSLPGSTASQAASSQPWNTTANPM